MEIKVGQKYEIDGYGSDQARTTAEVRELGGHTVTIAYPGCGKHQMTRSNFESRNPVLVEQDDRATLESIKRHLDENPEALEEARITLEDSIRVSVVHGIDSTLAERGSRYGDFRDHARIAQALQDAMRNFEKPLEPAAETFCNVRPWDHLPATHKQALTVIADKIARILSGDPNYADNWHDIQGYAKLVEDRL